MSKKATDIVLLRLLFEITQLLKSGSKGMTRHEISNAWVHDNIHTDEQHITKKTFTRDRQKISTLFGISIEYYSIDNECFFYIANREAIEKGDNLKFTLNAARMLQLQELFMLQGSRLDIHHFIDDIEKVLFFGDALKKNRTVHILYQRFNVSPIRPLDIEPYWMKDYEDRLYLIGHIPSWTDRTKVVCLALDRIQAFEVVPTKRSFHVPKGMDPITHYTHVCGVVVPEKGKPVKITIRAYDDEPCYLLTKPLHHSQQLIGTWDKSMPFADFELFLIPTLEFKKKIIERAGRIVVTSPDDVRADLLETIEKTASRFRGA